MWVVQDIHVIDFNQIVFNAERFQTAISLLGQTKSIDNKFPDREALRASSFDW